MSIFLLSFFVIFAGLFALRDIEYARQIASYSKAMEPLDHAFGLRKYPLASEMHSTNVNASIVAEDAEKEKGYELPETF
ncbi:MAG TPA: hypothetical protein VGD98_03875 [Ktedonobacteraceae bacterium]